MKYKHPRTVANLERLRQMLTDLADTTGTLHGWPYWKLTNEFNKRYTTETNPINFSTIRMYITQAKEAGWLVTLQESESSGVLTFVLRPPAHDDSATSQ